MSGMAPSLSRETRPDIIAYASRRGGSFRMVRGRPDQGICPARRAPYPERPAPTWPRAVCRDGKNPILVLPPTGLERENLDDTRCEPVLTIV